MSENNKTEEFLQKLAPVSSAPTLTHMWTRRRGWRGYGVGAGSCWSCPRKKAIEGYIKNQSNKTYMECIQIVHEHKGLI